MRRQATLVTALALLATGGLTACGGQDDEVSTSTSTVTSQAAESNAPASSAPASPAASAASGSATPAAPGSATPAASGSAVPTVDPAVQAQISQLAGRAGCESGTLEVTAAAPALREQGVTAGAQCTAGETMLLLVQTRTAAQVKPGMQAMEQNTGQTIKVVTGENWFILAATEGGSKIATDAQLAALAKKVDGTVVTA